MLRFTAYTFAFITLVFCVAVAAMMVTGRAVETYLLTLMTTNAQGNLQEQSTFHLIDIDRGLRISVRPPLENIQHVRMRFGYPEALLLVREYSPERNRTELYHFNITDRKLYLLYAPEQQEVLSFRSILDSGVWWSPDGRMVAFYDPDNPGIYIANLETQMTSLVAEVASTPRFPDYIAWSPDSQQLSILRDHMILAVNVDGSNRREFHDVYTLNTADFNPPLWSSDSRYILLSSYNLSRPIRVLDAQTGTLHPKTANLEGSRPVWSCDSDTLTFIRRSGIHPNILTDISILNLEDGTETNLSTHPVLAGQEITRISWIADCQWLLISGGPWRPSSTISSSFPLGSIYISDPQGEDIRMVSEEGWVMSLVEEGIVYVTPDETEPERNVIYSLTLGMETEPNYITEFSGNYQVLNSFYDWTRLLVMDSQAYPPGIRLAVLNTQTGQLRYLTDREEFVFSFAYWP